MKFLTFLIFVWLACRAIAQLPDASRYPITNSLPWSAGVSGGIPSYPTAVSVADYGAVADGVTDDYGAVTNAIAHCTNGGAVFFPAGIYFVGSQVLVPSRKVLRGSGRTQTTVKIGIASAVRAIYMTGGSTSGSNTLASGFTRGSTQIVANATTGLAVGQQVEVGQRGDTNILVGNIPASYPYQAQANQITAISGSTITLLRPLYWDLQSTNTPFIKTWSSYLTNAGVENMKLLVTSSADAAVATFRAMDCWVIGCEITNYSGQTGVVFDESYRCESHSNICHSYMTSGSRYGIQVSDYATDCLIEDNITGLTSSGIVVQNGSVGNVVAYNFYYDSWNNSNLAFSFHGHGGCPAYNLFEGNVGNGIMGVDNTWGANPYFTFLRNWATAYSTNASTSRSGMRFDGTNYYDNAIGNILCKPSDFGVLTGNPFPMNFAGNGAADANTIATAFIHGQYEFRTNSTTWAIADHSIPASYYLSGRPSWWSADLPWPSIGPDIALTTSSGITNYALIPAQERYTGLRGNYGQMNTTDLRVGTIRTAQ